MGQNMISEAHFGNLEAKATKNFKLRLEAHFGPVQAQDIKMVKKQLVKGSASDPSSGSLHRPAPVHSEKTSSNPININARLRRARQKEGAPTTRH